MSTSRNQTNLSQHDIYPVPRDINKLIKSQSQHQSSLIQKNVSQLISNNKMIAANYQQLLGILDKEIQYNSLNRFKSSEGQVSMKKIRSLEPLRNNNKSKTQPSSTERMQKFSIRQTPNQSQLKIAYPSRVKLLITELPINSQQPLIGDHNLQSYQSFQQPKTISQASNNHIKKMPKISFYTEQTFSDQEQESQFNQASHLDNFRQTQKSQNIELNANNKELNANNKELNKKYLNMIQSLLVEPKAQIGDNDQIIQRSFLQDKIRKDSKDLDLNNFLPIDKQLDNKYNENKQNEKQIEKIRLSHVPMPGESDIDSNKKNKQNAVQSNQENQKIKLYLESQQLLYQQANYIDLEDYKIKTPASINRNPNQSLLNESPYKVQKIPSNDNSKLRISPNQIIRYSRYPNMNSIKSPETPSEQPSQGKNLDQSKLIQNKQTQELESSKIQKPNINQPNLEIDQVDEAYDRFLEMQAYIQARRDESNNIQNRTSTQEIDQLPSQQDFRYQKQNEENNKQNSFKYVGIEMPSLADQEVGIPRIKSDRENYQTPQNGVRQSLMPKPKNNPEVTYLVRENYQNSQNGVRIRKPSTDKNGDSQNINKKQKSNLQLVPYSRDNDESQQQDIEIVADTVNDVRVSRPIQEKQQQQSLMPKSKNNPEVTYLVRENYQNSQNGVIIRMPSADIENGNSQNIIKIPKSNLQQQSLVLDNAKRQQQDIEIVSDSVNDVGVSRPIQDFKNQTLFELKNQKIQKQQSDSQDVAGVIQQKGENNLYYHKGYRIRRPSQDFENADADPKNFNKSLISRKQEQSQIPDSKNIPEGIQLVRDRNQNSQRGVRLRRPSQDIENTDSLIIINSQNQKKSQQTSVSNSKNIPESTQLDLENNKNIEENTFVISNEDNIIEDDESQTPRKKIQFQLYCQIPNLYYRDQGEKFGYCNFYLYPRRVPTEQIFLNIPKEQNIVHFNQRKEDENSYLPKELPQDYKSQQIKTLQDKKYIRAKTEPMRAQNQQIDDEYMKILRRQNTDQPREKSQISYQPQSDLSRMIESPAQLSQLIKTYETIEPQLEVEKPLIQETKLVTKGKHVELIVFKSPRRVSVLIDKGLILQNQGIALQKQGRNKEAMIQYKQAIEANSKLEIARINLGALLSQYGKYDEAKKVFDEAISITPNNANLYLNKGISLKNQNQYEAALNCFLIATSIDEENILAFINKAYVEYQLRQNQQAIISLQKSNSLLQDARAQSLSDDLIEPIHQQVNNILDLMNEFTDKAQDLESAKQKYSDTQALKIPIPFRKILYKYEQLNNKRDQIIKIEFDQIQEGLEFSSKQLPDTGFNQEASHLMDSLDQLQVNLYELGIN